MNRAGEIAANILLAIAVFIAMPADTVYKTPEPIEFVGFAALGDRCPQIMILDDALILRFTTVRETRMVEKRRS